MRRTCPKHPSQPADECGVCERLIADAEDFHDPHIDHDPSGEMADHEAVREADLMRRQWP